MITAKDGEMGRNFMTPAIAQFAWRELAYREPGALIDERRLLTNLLSSMPLTFNLLGPWQLDTKLATAILRNLDPQFQDANVEMIAFEHSPGRGNPTFTGDYTAFDAMIAYSRPNNIMGFIAIEVKYSESAGEPKQELKPRYNEIAPSAGLHRDPASSLLCKGNLQQFFRQHILAQTLLGGKGWDEGHFVVIAPRLNLPMQAAIAGYRAHLNPLTKDQVAFDSWSLEDVIDQFRVCGEQDYAEMLEQRYCDWQAIDRVIDAAIATVGSTAPACPDDREEPVQDT